jgi:hypothetical protein
MHYTAIAICLIAVGCDPDNGNDDAQDCSLAESVAIDARAGDVQADGSVTVYGSVRFAPLSGGDNGSVADELAVYAVYVADQEVQPASTDFNYRSWTLSLQPDRLAAFTVTAMDGTKTATLPVRAIVHGGCVKELAEESRPIVELPATPTTP